MKTELERWFLYEYKDGQVVILSRPFKTKVLAENERLKYSERKRRQVGVGRGISN